MQKLVGEMIGGVCVCGGGVLVWEGGLALRGYRSPTKGALSILEGRLFPPLQRES